MGALDEGHFCDDLDGTTMGFNNVDLVVENEYSSIEDAVKILLQGLGEDCEREGLKKTPLRVAKAFREGTRGYQQDVDDIVQGALFPEAGLDNGLGHAGGAGGLVVVRDIDLFSYCESCLLPFKVKCHVGYVPSGRRVVGLSKLSRVAEVFAKRLQDPHRLATEICTSLNNSIKPSGVAVALQCWHLQFPTAECNAHDSHEATKTGMRGWIQICAYSGSGVFENKNTESWFDFLAMLKFKGVNIEKSQKQSSPAQSWCPSKSHELGTCHGHSSRHSLNGKTSSHKQGTIPSSMVSAVSSIIHSLGENPSRKELVGTPRRFVQWIMNFRRANLEMKFNNSCNPIREIRNIDKNEIHSELNLPFWSQCEHHLLPFHGVVHIGYLGAQDTTSMDRTVLQSIVHFYGCKLQVQERLTRQIAETVSSLLSRSVIVVVEANHICMISRGIEKVGSSTATIAVLGQFSSDPTAKANFLQIISNHTFYDA